MRQSNISGLPQFGSSPLFPTVMFPLIPFHWIHLFWTRLPLGPVSAWVGDRLWTGKPPRCRTRHPGLVGLSPPSVVRLEWVPGKSWGSKQAYRVMHHPACMVLQCSLNASLKGLASGDQRRLMGSGSTLETCLRQCAIQVHSLLYWYLQHNSSH